MSILMQVQATIKAASGRLVVRKAATFYAEVCGFAVVRFLRSAILLAGARSRGFMLRSVVTVHSSDPLLTGWRMQAGVRTKCHWQAQLLAHTLSQTHLLRLGSYFFFSWVFFYYRENLRIAKYCVINKFCYCCRLFKQLRAKRTNARMQFAFLFL